jgi:ssDNA-binding Zn-finger/Zn-ribbon topoisomerase 1
MKPENVTCPLCNGPMTPRMSAHGKFWGCRAYPRCRGTRNSDGEVNTPRQTDAARRGGDESDLPSRRQAGNDRRRWDR